MTVLLESDGLTREAIRDAVGHVDVVGSFDELAELIGHRPDLDTVILGPSVDLDRALEFADRLRGTDPTVGVVLVRRRIDAAILSQAIRSGMREVLPERDLPSIAAAVQRSRTLTLKLRNPGELASVAGPGEVGRLIAVLSPKGGVGKTTLAVNMGAFLAAQGYRTLLLDLDLDFGDVPISLGLRPAHTTSEVVGFGDRLDASALRRLVTVHDSGLHVLAAPGEVGAIEQVPAALIRRLLKVAAADYQYVLVDTPPAIDDRTMTVVEEADTVFLLTTLDIASLKDAKVALETLRMLKVPTDRLRVVMNRADSQVGLDAREAQFALGTQVVASIPSSRDVPASTNRGVAIVVDQPKHRVSAAIRALIQQELAPAPAEPPEAPKPAGRFGRRWVR
jgi:pilus assembly protein CpaE